MSVIHKLPQIILRDGGIWRCHYCGIDLVPLGTKPGTEPYYQLIAMKTAHPKTCGDGGGRWTYDECVAAIEATITGDLIHWSLWWELTPGYAYPAVDHKIPKSKGGSNRLDNLVASCQKCNQRKRAQDYDHFVARLHRNSKRIQDEH